ncbi:MAG: malto-oligosyltrehalose synthase [Thermodesulfobacteriota bacterium]
MIHSTYRIQFHPGYGFAALEHDAAYLRDLGVAAVYASPIFEAQTGSTHGYDILDPNRIRPELGGQAAFATLTDRMQSLGLEWVQDIVPNHMALDAQNPYLFDVLLLGRKSTQSDVFSIDWEHPDPVLHGRLGLPLLGEPYKDALESGRLQLSVEQGALWVCYFEHRFPLSSGGVQKVLYAALQRRAQGEVARILTEAQDKLAAWSFAQGASWLARQCSQQESLQRILETTCAEMPPADLHTILCQEAYALLWWKTAALCLNYTRFFSINDLIRVRVEEESVFERTHELIDTLVAQGRIQGLRVDHVDGLLRPGEYVRRLQARHPVPIWVEKILAPEERLPQEWPVCGSTGYDFLYWSQALLTEPQGAQELLQLFARLGTGESAQEMVRDAKTQVLYAEFEGDLKNTAVKLRQLAAQCISGRDLLGSRLEAALAAVVIGLPVYRLYGHNASLSQQEQEALQTAVGAARATRPELEPEIAFVEQVLSWSGSDDGPQTRELWQDFWERFQQLASPVTAKGVEDTFVYRYFPLACAAEVGCEPAEPSRPPHEFATWMQGRLCRWPQAMNATATHDTKRGEDTRARLVALSERSAHWQHHLPQWQALLAPLLKEVDGCQVPDTVEQYLLLQTLLGTWPVESDPEGTYTTRMQEYMTKALREAKRHTDWAKPHPDYEQAVQTFVARLLESPEGEPFREAFVPFVRDIAFGGMLNSLAQVVLKCLLPGIPDIYQGCEYWDLSLVDPDNRRPVDYERRRTTLASLQQALRADPWQCWREVCAHWPDGRLKQLVLHLCLQARHNFPDTFLHGEFLPLPVQGPRAENVFVFLRHYGSTWILAAVPRLSFAVAGSRTWPVGDVWEGTVVRMPRVTGGRWQCQLTGEGTTTGDQIEVQDLFAELPMALWVGERERGQCPI